MAVRTCEEWDVAYCVLNGIQNTDAAGIAIILLPNAEGLAFINECSSEDPGQPLSKCVSELHYVSTFDVRVQ